MWCGPVESGTDCGNGETGKGMNGVVGWRDDVMEVCLALFLDFCFFCCCCCSVFSARVGTRIVI